MFKIKYHDLHKISSNQFFSFIQFLSKPETGRFSRHYSKYAKNIEPVKIAYSSYESTDPNEINGSNKYPVVIMHGLLGSKNNWNSLSKSIHTRTKHKIIAVDVRNHGDSPQTPDFNYPCLAEDIRELMADLNITKINAVGHSLGGRAMMFLALKYPHLINSLVVVDISPVRTSPAIVELSEMFNAMLSVKLEHNIPLSMARNIVDKQLLHVIPDPYIRQFLLTNLVEVEGQYKWRVNLESLINNFASIVNFQPPSGKYRGPVIFIGGSQSTFLLEEDHKGILQLFPKSEFKYIQGAGHWVHSEKPAEFLDLVCEFLMKLNK